MALYKSKDKGGELWSVQDRFWEAHKNLSNDHHKHPFTRTYDDCKRYFGWVMLCSAHGKALKGFSILFYN